MNIKALKEKRNAKNEELKQMLEVASDEIRGFNKEEDEKFSAIEQEIRELDSTIEKGERTNKETSKVVDKEVRADVTDEEKEKRGMEQYIKGQDGEEVRAMVTSNNGAIIPTHLHKNVVKKLEEYAPLWSKIPKLTPVNGYLEILKEKDYGTAAFVGEMTNLTPNDFSFEKVKLEQRRCGSAVELSQHLINDSGINIVEYCTDALYRRMALILDKTVVQGVIGLGQFEGLMRVDESRYVENSAVGKYSIDDFMNVMNEMHPSLQSGAVWVMNRKLFNKVALLKDAVGNYYLTRQMNVVTNKPEYRLFGHEILINDAVDIPGTASNQIAYFVNFNEAYAGMIKKDIEFSHISGDTHNRMKGQHTFVLDMYCDAKIVRHEAISVLVEKKA